MDRTIGYDVARGVAILIMLIINFKGALSAHDSNPQWLSDAINFLDRRAAIILVMISGIGLTLSTKAPDTNNCLLLREGSRSLLLNRASFLLISGYLLSIIWAGDILHFYAVFILFGIVLAPSSNKILLISACMIWMGSFFQFFDISDHLQSGNGNNIFIDELIDIFFSGYYPFFPWATFFIIGMLLGRSRLCDKKHRRTFLLGGLTIFISSEMISDFFTTYSLRLVSEPGKIYTALELFCLKLGWITSIDLTSPTPFSVISGIGTGIIVIMISISLSAGQNVQWARYITIAGRNTLTLYITHIVFLIIIIPILNISNGSNLSLITVGAFVFFFTFIELISCWLKKHKKGPLEMLMRKFSVRRLIVGRTSHFPGIAENKR